jgi:hypothetical protein
MTLGRGAFPLYKCKRILTTVLIPIFVALVKDYCIYSPLCSVKSDLLLIFSFSLCSADKMFVSLGPVC